MAAIARVRGAGATRTARKNAAKRDEKRINWAGVREEYVTGSETLAQIAKRLGVSAAAVEQHAANRGDVGKTWGESREDFREDVARTFRMEAQKRQVEAALSVHDAQARAVEHIVAAALPLALDKLARADQFTGYEAVRAIISALAAQRKVHGLDQAMRVEVTGKNGGAIEHDVALGEPLADDARAIAERCLEALFGKTAEPG